MTQGFAGLSGNLRGGVWMLLAAAFFSGLNALVKDLGGVIPPIELVFFRSLFGLLVLVPLLIHGGREVLKVERPEMHLYRIALGLGAMALSFEALARLPLAGSISLFFTKPLFVIVLAAVFLGERPNWRRSLATVTGLAGVLVMMRPWHGGIDAAMVVAVLSALCMAAVMVVIKHMTASERPLTMVAYFSAGCSLGTLPATLLVWRWPDAHQLGLMAAMGFLGSVAQYFVVKAYHAGEATAVSPVDYVQLIFAAAIGYWVFGEVPDLWMALGAAVVVASSWTVVRQGTNTQQGTEETCASVDKVQS
jgi:drug/metabolite transporter (DMT)-like permease